MLEKNALDSEAPSVTPKETESLGQSQVAVAEGTPKESKEVFLGGMIIVVVCLLLLILAGTFGFFGYRMWQASKVEQATPSIQELGEKVAEARPAESAPVAETPAVQPTTPSNPSVSTPDKSTIEVKVMNGGGARGSASTLTDLLKKAGYSKTTFGNTTLDYTGVTIYYSGENEGAANSLKEEVLKTYPNTTVAPAKTAEKDTTVATLVVILGK